MNEERDTIYCERKLPWQVNTVDITTGIESDGSAFGGGKEYFAVQGHVFMQSGLLILKLFALGMPRYSNVDEKVVKYAILLESKGRAALSNSKVDFDELALLRKTIHYQDHDLKNVYVRDSCDTDLVINGSKSRDSNPDVACQLY